MEKEATQTLSTASTMPDRIITTSTAIEDNSEDIRKGENGLMNSGDHNSDDFPSTTRINQQIILNLSIFMLAVRQKLDEAVTKLKSINVKTDFSIFSFSLNLPYNL